MSRRLSAASLLVIPGLAACAAVGPAYAPPSATAPTAFLAATNTTAAPPRADWWSLWNDPVLTGLMERVSARNLSLRQAALLVVQARNQEAVARSATAPSVQAQALGGVLQASDAEVTLPGLPAPLPHTFQSSGDRAYLVGAGLVAGLEPDLFGHARRTTEAAAAAREEAEWSAKDAFVLISAEVAEAYVSLRGSQAKARLLREEIAAQRGLVAFARFSAQVGEQPGAEAERPAGELSALEAALAETQSEAQLGMIALSALVDEPVEQLAPTLAPLRSSSGEGVSVPVGLPSELLQRRPDIRAAERRVAAATAKVGVATAELYPRFQLTAGPNLVSGALSGLISLDGPGGFAGVRLLWPVLDGGRGKLAVASADVTRQQAVLQYRQIVLDALRDVNAAITRVDSADRAAQALGSAVASARNADAQARHGQAAGLLNDSQVLPARKALAEAELAQLQVQTAHARALVGLFKALGGGWAARPAGS